MASEIKVDTIVNAGGDNDTGIDLATNDQILLKVANATKLTMNSTGQTTIISEGGANTTSLQQGLAKVWTHWNADGTPAFRDSINSASITDHATGDQSINFTNGMSNANYAVSGTVGNGNNNDTTNAQARRGSSSTTAQRYTIQYATADAIAQYDYQYVSGIVHGDLA
jgi:hypothetical protein